MAFNKKTWEDNVSDLTAAELNRMEQGIYDNSLVVDLIKDKLNPTDTEAYKTAELTEGQITDVIGVSDIVIKGQTEQNGTPTPSAPVDVNVVSGSNVINIYNGQTLSKELPLDLPVENLFNKNNYVAGKCYSNNQITANTPWGIYYLPCIIGETYIISGLKTYSGTQIVQCNSNKQFILNLVTRSTENTEYTITATQNGYIGISFVWSASASKGSELDTINIKKAGTEPIELCKIGNYQDYFYKSGSKWYLHKGIKKLTGNDIISTSAFTESPTYSDSTYLCCYNNGFQNTTYLNTRAYCNKFDGQYHYGENKVANNIRMGGSSLGICVLKSDFATVNDLNSYFNTNGNDIFVYIVLKTPTNTEITDTTLISQLNAIINSPLYEDTNITQTNNDLPMVLDITACKDNINGIKAWIRK